MATVTKSASSTKANPRRETILFEIGAVIVVPWPFLFQQLMTIVLIKHQSEGPNPLPWPIPAMGTFASSFPYTGRETL